MEDQHHSLSSNERTYITSKPLMLKIAVHKKESTGERDRKLMIPILVWGLAVIVIIPAVCRWTAPPPSAGKFVGYFVLAASSAAICYYLYRRESLHLSRHQSIVLVFLAFLLTCIANHIHGVNVDHGMSYFDKQSNVAWQETTNDLVIQRSSSALPHSYRFLPNSIVRWMQMSGLAYEQARDLYRLIFGILLFYAIYKYARLYTNYLGAVIAMLLVGVAYPVSFEWSAGQLTDPLSHLSFVLAFIFLETEDFALLLTTLLVGSLAKETVLAMTGYYVLFCRKERSYVRKAITLCLASTIMYIGVRLLVLKGGMHYGQVSGVPVEQAWSHVLFNLRDPRWPRGFLLTVGAFAPFLALAWKETPRSLKHQVLFLFPVLFLSGIFFSFLREMRNFMPLVFVLAVAAACYLSGPLTEQFDTVRIADGRRGSEQLV